ncbi:MAG: MBL fold metallo-hydrolase [Bacteroidetes bacterium]|nr:MBL fold metallo-hydrolase [Bacteroidota bacterium]
MSLSIASLNSGSNGNCYYVGNADEGVLIDAGISCRETERRLKKLGLSIKMVKAIFITHEHADHINGLPKLVKKHHLPVYMTHATRSNLRSGWAEIRAISFQAYEPITVGNLTVTAFPKFHDAADPHSFTVSHNNVNVGVFTDTGRNCEHLIKNFEKCHAAFLESNYDEDMLETGGYPQHLKNRIRNGHGHLSNKQALQLFLNHRPAFMSHLILSHLSANNNKPEIVDSAFKSAAGKTEIVIASRKKETALYHIHGRLTDQSQKSRNPQLKHKIQLSLFEGAHISPVINE